MGFKSVQELKHCSIPFRRYSHLTSLVYFTSKLHVTLHYTFPAEKRSDKTVKEVTRIRHPLTRSLGTVHRLALVNKLGGARRLRYFWLLHVKIRISKQW
jgi:hypothetical protein